MDTYLDIQCAVRVDLSPPAHTSALEVEWLDELLNSVMHSHPISAGPHLPSSPRDSKLALLTPVHPSMARLGLGGPWAHGPVRRSPPPAGAPCTPSSHHHGPCCGIVHEVRTCLHPQARTHARIPSPTRAGPPPTEKTSMFIPVQPVLPPPTLHTHTPCPSGVPSSLFP